MVYPGIATDTVITNLKTTIANLDTAIRKEMCLVAKNTNADISCHAEKKHLRKQEKKILKRQCPGFFEKQDQKKNMITNATATLENFHNNPSEIDGNKAFEILKH